MADDPAPSARASRSVAHLRLLLLAVLAGALLVQTAAVFWGIVTIAGNRMPDPGAAIGRDWVQNGDGWQLQRIRRDGGIRLRSVREDGPAAAAGLKGGDLIVTVNARSVMDHPDEWFRARLRGAEGDSLRLTWLRDGSELSGALVLGPRAEGRAMQTIQGRAYISLPYRVYCWVMYGDLAALYLILLLAGSIVGFVGWRDERAFWFSLFFLSMGLAGFAPVKILLVALWPLWFLAALGLVSAVLMAVFGWIALRAFAVFPRPSRLGRALLRWQWVVLLLGVHVVGRELGYFADLFPSIRPAAAALSWLGLGGAPQIAWLLMIVALLVAQRVESGAQPERRVRVIEAGFNIIGIAIAVNFIGQLRGTAGAKESFAAYAILWYLASASLFLFPIGLGLVAYGVLSRRVFGLRFVFRRGLQHLLLSRAVILVEAFVVFLLVEELLRRSGSEIARSVPFVAALSMATGAAFLAGLRRVSRPLMQRIDRWFFVEAHDARRVLLDVGQRISAMRDGPEIIRTSGTAILSALHPERAAVLVVKPDAPDALASAWAGHGRVPSGRDAGREPATGVGRGAWSEVAPPAEARTVSVVSDAALDALRAGRSWVDIARDSEADTEAAGGPSPPPGPPAPWELLIPVRVGEELLGCIALAGKLSEEPYSGEDRELLLAVATQMGLALRNVELIEVARREAQQARDIEIARKVQQGLFPKELPRADGWDLAAFCRPARAVGGDYYDLFDAGTDRIVLALGDVSGKGLGASLLMANLHALIRSRASQAAADLGALMAEINDHLYASTPPEMFATLFLGVLDTRTGRFRYVNAGHPPPWLLSPAACEHRLLSGGGIPAGMMPGMPFEEGEVELDPGDALVIYSDGVTEAADAGGTLFEEAALGPALEALLEGLRRHRPGKWSESPIDQRNDGLASGRHEARVDEPPVGGSRLPRAVAEGSTVEPGPDASEWLLRELTAQVDRFASGTEQGDDISVVVVSRKTPQ